ncbi:MAG TPA: hypothetical protein VGB67_06475 [Fibrella sp.]
MQTIRTSLHQQYPGTQPSSFWTSIRRFVVPIIEANAEAFEALSRMGQPFGGNIISR